MNRRSKAILFAFAFGIVAFAVLFAIDQAPRNIEKTISQLFGYEFQDAYEVIRRDHEAPLSIQGVAYWEEVTLRLSNADYQRLSSILIADTSFEEKEIGGKMFRERFIVGDELTSWCLDPLSREFSYSYFDY
jgi:hypothetical protein